MNESHTAPHVIEDLVASWQKGDESAFNSLYTLFTVRLYRFALVRIGNRDDAQDIVGETWKAVVSHISSYQRGNFQGFLFRIAYTQLIAHVRKQKKASSLDEAGSIATQELPLDEQLNNKEEVQKVFRALEKMPVLYKDIILLRLVEGFSIIQTAQVLGKSSVMIRVTQHRAVKKLQELLP